MTTRRKKPTVQTECVEAFTMRLFRLHAKKLRATGASQITASFGPDIVFTVTYTEDIKSSAVGGSVSDPDDDGPIGFH